MSKEGKRDGLGAWFGDIGKVLAEGVKQDPLLAAIVLVVLIVVVAVVAAFATIAGLITLGVVAVFALVILLVFGYRRSTAHLKPKEHTLPAHVLTTFQNLSNDRREEVVRALGGAAHEIAIALAMNDENVRANLFALGADGQLRIVPHIQWNMNRPEELTLAMPVGSGSSGRAFATGNTNIAVFQSDWGANVLKDDELKKVHPGLRWIISVPISGADHQPLFVLNVDGVDVEKSELELAEASKGLAYWGDFVRLAITEEN